jgi:hypothetical protein
VGEGIAHAPQGVEGPFHRGLDQPKAVGQADARPEGSQRAICLKQGIAPTWGRQQDGLQETLQGRIHTSNTHQNGASTALFEHL